MYRQSSSSPATSAAADDLMFVNVSHPEDIRRQRDVQTKIRRHVMKRVGQDRRQPSPEPKKSTVAHVAPHRTPDNGELSPEAQYKLAISPGRSLETLGSFPVECNTRVLELVRIFNESASFDLPFRRAWFNLALSDAGAFHVTMGNSAAFNLTINSSNEMVVPETPEITKHYSEGLRFLRRRLNSVSESSSQGIIANILAHVCLNMRQCNWHRWKVHMDGLTQVIEVRGGLDTLEHEMPVLVTQYDLAGAAFFDSLPRFPLPAVLTEPRPVFRPAPLRLQCLLRQLNHMSPDMTQAGKALHDLSIIADVVNLNSSSTQFWKNDMGAFFLIGPYIHFLLSMTRLPTEFEKNLPQSHRDDLIMKEIVRVVCLVLMSRLKETFSFFTIERAALQAKFAGLVPLTRQLDETYLQVKLWALVTEALLEARENRGIYLDEIARSVSTMGNQADCSVIQEARELIWINCLESPTADEVQRDLMLRMITYGHKNT